MKHINTNEKQRNQLDLYNNHEKQLNSYVRNQMNTYEQPRNQDQQMNNRRTNTEHRTTHETYENKQERL